MGQRWITNDSDMAARLHAIDNAYQSAREAARDLSLADKVAAYRAATLARDAAYAVLLRESV